MKKLVAVFFFALSAFYLSAQGGAQITAGLVSLNNNSTQITGENQFHSGYSIGIQSRLKDGNFVAGPGLKYTRFSMMSSESTAFFNKEENYHMLSLPFNVGLEYRLAYIMKLRLYTGGDAHYFLKIDDNQRDINYDYVKDVFFGAHAGIGVDLHWVTLDLIYERGLTSAHNIENSKYNWLTFSLGFFF